MSESNRWEEAWRAGRTGWDAGAPAPALVELLAARRASWGDAAPGRALVPGCGAGYDVVALAEAGFSALGVDVAPSAAARFEEVRAGVEHAEVRVGDLFAPGVLDEGARFEVIWDYTFLCALDPSLRPRWAERLVGLLARGGELWTLIFPVPPGLAPGEVPEPVSGPPYPVSPALVEGLLAPHGLVRRSLARVERSHPGREGKEYIARWGRA